MSPMVRQPMTIEHALLGFLREKPLHGYEIHRRISDPEGLGLVWQVKQSQLYALLGKLEESGYVTGELEPQGSRPPRKIYSLTEAGSRTFAEWVGSPVPHGREMRLNFMVKLYFARKEGKNIVSRLIEEQRGMCVRWLDVVEVSTDGDPGSFRNLIEGFRAGQIEAMLAWLDLCESQYSK